MRRESDHQRGQPRALEAARVCGHSDGAVQAGRGGGGGGGRDSAGHAQQQARQISSSAAI